MALTSKLAAIGDAIRSKTGKSGKLTLDQMPAEIESIETGSSDVPFAFGGMNAVKVSEYSETYTLADTSFNAASATSTSATSIKATVANRYTNTTGSPTYAYGDKDIVVVQRLTAVPTVVGGDHKAEAIKSINVYVSRFSKRKTTDTSAKTTRQVVNESMTMTKYWNTSGTVSRGNISYGIYGTCAAPTVYSATSASTYVRVGSPVLYYRVSTSYMKKENMALVTGCDFVWTVEVYTVDPLTTSAATFNDAADEFLCD